MNKKIKLSLNKNTCIDCGSCLAKANKHMSEDQKGYIHIIKGTTEQGIEQITLDTTEKEVENLKAAMEICPTESVNVKEV